MTGVYMYFFYLSHQLVAEGLEDHQAYFCPHLPLTIKGHKRPDCLAYANIMSDFPVVWGVLRVILSGPIHSEGEIVNNEHVQ